MTWFLKACAHWCLCFALLGFVRANTQQDLIHQEVAEYLTQRDLDLAQYQLELLSTEQKEQTLVSYNFPDDLAQELARESYSLLRLTALEVLPSGSFYCVVKHEEDQLEVVGNLGLRSKNGFINDLREKLLP